MLAAVEMVPSLLDTLSTPLLLKSFASSLLAIPPTDSDSPSATPTPTDLASPAPGPSPPPVHPLAVLLFLLDGLVFLRSAGPLGDRIRRERLSTTGLGIGIDGGDEADVEDGPTKGTPSRRASVCVDKARTAADSDSESWEDWVAYISEMYAHPRTDDAPIWSPLPIPPSVITSLSALSASDDYTPTSHSLLARACESALAHLAADSNDPPPPLDSLLTLPHASFPLLLSSSVLSTIASTLASCRRSTNAAGAPTLTFRSIVSTILEHLTRCGESEVNTGMEKLYPIKDHIEDHDEAEDRGLKGAEDSVREASLSIVRRDDKLRWIFGDNFQKRASESFPSSANTTPHHSPPQALMRPSPPTPVARPASPPPPPKSPPSHHRRPASMSSFESLASHFSGSTSASRPHRRVYSTSSSIVPLLSSVAPPSIVDPDPPAPPRSPVPFGNFSITPLPDPPISPPPFSSTKAAFSASASTTSFPTPRVVAHSHSLSSNTLSPHARRELVRKSKKLNRMFGVPLEEHAAHAVLVRPLPGESSEDEERPQWATAKGRRYSFPPGGGTPSPTREEAVGMARSSSTPGAAAMYRARGSLGGTDEENTGGKVGGGKVKERMREERRRKLDKVQRLLGEKVPVALVLANNPPGGRTTAESPVMARGNSRLGGLLKGLGFGGGRKRDGTGESSGVETDLELRGEDDGGEEMQVSAPIVNFMAPVAKKEATAVQELARTRKMEQVFGTLPPSAMYLHVRSVSTPLSARTPAVPADRNRPMSSMTTTSRTSTIESYRQSIASLQYLLETDPSALDEIALVYTRDGGATPSSSRPGSRPSSRRQSNAASRGSRPGRRPVPHEPNWDDDSGSPGGPIEVTDSEVELEMRLRLRGMHSRTESGVLSDGASSAGSAFEPEELEFEMGAESVPEEEEEGAPVEVRARRRPKTGDSIATTASTRSPGSTRKQTVKKAQKLASFFGTSRGEVWSMLLDDLEAAIVEEEGVDEEERSEVLYGVSRLRRQM